MKNNTIHIKKVKIKNNALGFQVPDDYEIYKVEGNPDDIFLRKKKVNLPTSWEEFCRNYPVKDSEVYINNASEINTYGIDIESIIRNTYTDKNLLPNKELAGAMLALCQLLQLREVYNNGWKPDFSDGSKKYIIYTYHNEINSGYTAYGNYVLCFKTEDICNKFLKNFRDLIEIAKPLL